jgi:ketosteroid isomerase-like protein
VVGRIVDTRLAMSHENVEMVRALLGAFDRADYEAALEALDPEIEWQAPPGITIGQEIYRGRDEVQRGFAEWLTAWDTHRFEPEEMLDHREHVVVGGRQIGRGRGSGVEVRLPTFHVFTLRKGKVTRHRSYEHRAEALEAAGLRE